MFCPGKKMVFTYASVGVLIPYNRRSVRQRRLRKVIPLMNAHTLESDADHY